MYGIKATIEFAGDVEAPDRYAEALSPPASRRFFDNVGVYVRQQMHDRLVAQVSNQQLRSPGLRQALLQPTTTPGGVYDLGNAHVEVGSNLPHAHKIHVGGPIVPKSGKALAIPILDHHKRESIWPRDLDPGRKILTFIPAKRPGGLIGVLVDQEGRLGFGENKALYRLVTKVSLTPRPYLYLDQGDLEEIELMLTDHLEAEAGHG